MLAVFILVDKYALIFEGGGTCYEKDFEVEGIRLTVFFLWTFKGL